MWFMMYNWCKLLMRSCLSNVQIRRREPNAMNTSEWKNVLSLLLSLLHYWCEHQILRNVLKAVCILITCFLTNFLITKSILTLRNTEIHVWLLFSTLMIGWNLLTQTNPLSKMEFKYILFCRLSFCSFTHSLCENENIPMRGKRIAP